MDETCESLTSWCYLAQRFLKWKHTSLSEAKAQRRFLSGLTQKWLRVVEERKNLHCILAAGGSRSACVTSSGQPGFEKQLYLWSSFLMQHCFWVICYLSFLTFSRAMRHIYMHLHPISGTIIYSSDWFWHELRINAGISIHSKVL